MIVALGRRQCLVSREVTRGWAPDPVNDVLVCVQARQRLCDDAEQTVDILVGDVRSYDDQSFR